MSSLLVDVREPSKEATEWWNMVNGNKDSPDEPIPSRPVSASTMRRILVPLSPYFGLALADDMSDDAFYTLLHRVVILMHQCEFVPLPQLLFREFVDHLYNIRDSFTKRDLGVVITLLEWVPGSATPMFLFYEFKQRVKDITLVFDTLIELMLHKHQLWKSVISTNRAADAVFEKFVPLLDGDAADDVKMHALDFLSLALIEHSKLLSDLVMAATSLWEKMVKLLHSPNRSLVLTSLRSMIYVWNGSKAMFAPIHHNRWAMEMVNETMRPCIAHDLVMNFLFQVKLEGFNVSYLVKMLLLQGPEQPDDFLYLKRLCFVKHYHDQVVVIRYMLGMVGCNRHWAATCRECLKELLPRFSEKPNVGSFVMSFAKQAFLFVGLCAEKGKYKRRVRAILDAFEAFYRLRLDYLNVVINRLYTTLVNIDRLKKDAAKIPVGREIDSEFVEKLVALQKQPIVLKRFLVYVRDERLTVATEVRRLKRGRVSLNDLERGLAQSNADFRHSPSGRISLLSSAKSKRLTNSSAAMIKRNDRVPPLPSLVRSPKQ